MTDISDLRKGGYGEENSTGEKAGPDGSTQQDSAKNTVMTASSKVFQDFRRSFTTRAGQAIVAQELDKAFFRSMAVPQREPLPSADPLRRAVSAGDPIGVQMVSAGVKTVISVYIPSTNNFSFMLDSGWATRQSSCRGDESGS